MIGGTAGRTRSNGEGLQHQDGHSLLNAIAFPTVRAYDPAFAYEVVVIILEGLKRMFQEGEECIYYLMAENDAYEHPEMPDGCEEGIIKGMYKFNSREVENAKGSGAIVRQWSDPELRAGGTGIVGRKIPHRQRRLERHQLHATAPRGRRLPALEHAASDRNIQERAIWKRFWPVSKAHSLRQAITCEHSREQLTPWIPGDYYVLGTDGMGRSETREALRRHFEVDAESITIATLSRLSKTGLFTANEVADAIKDLGFDAEKPNPYFA